MVFPSQGKWKNGAFCIRYKIVIITTDNMDTETRNGIIENYQCIMDSIVKSCQRVGRNPDDVKLVVVSKRKPVESILAAYQAGARFFGENYPEMAVPKIEALKNIADIEWHMIGHVQSRKAKLIPGNFSLMHSMDSLKLAEKFDQLLTGTAKPQSVLLEVNVAGEISKGGWDASNQENWYKIEEEFNKIIALPGLSVEGLMSMPPMSNDPQESRPYFKKLRAFQEFLMKRTAEVYWKDLSIGTSGDYLVAVEEGARYVRVGQAILGKRN
jgi:PLP dependent protein